MAAHDLLKEYALLRRETALLSWRVSNLPDNDDTKVLRDTLWQYSEFISRVDSAVGRLPDKLYNVVKLRYYEDKPIADIAGLLCVHPATVFRRLDSAYKMLDEKIIPESFTAPQGEENNG